MRCNAHGGHTVIKECAHKRSLLWSY